MKLASSTDVDSRDIEERAFLLLCTNALYLQHAAVCVVSLLANNPTTFFEVVLVSRAGESLDEAKLRQSVAAFPNHSLTLRQFTPPPDRRLPLNPQAHYTLDIWTRLWVADFFGPGVTRVLYLDSDVVITGSITPLWHTDLSGALLGAINIPGSQQGVTKLGMRPDDGYFNSGVLLIDLSQWRETCALETILDYVAANHERLHDPDQDALNACFHDRTKRLAYEWNVIWPFFREPLALPLPRQEIEAVRQGGRIIHFNGGSKPWSYFCNHPRKPEYERYLEMTAWRDFVPVDRTPGNRIRKQVAGWLPAKIKDGLKKIFTPLMG